MTGETVLQTERLTLRNWHLDDLDHLASMNVDDKVMRFFPDRPDRDQSAQMLARVMGNIQRHGFGFWVLERLEDNAFVGFAGLLHPAFHTHFTPCVEVGWRLKRSIWGQGYATEAGRASLDFAFERLGVDQVVSMAVVDNLPSRRVMERLGM
ncbi:MAG: GNAT family N-acetyltransferase, partial [Pseudomonadota bacterium]